MACLLTLVVLVWCVAGCQGQQRCNPPTHVSSTFPYAYQPPPNQASSKDIYLGGIFGVHEAISGSLECGEVRERGIQDMEAFFYAVRTFQSRHDVLKDFEIGAFAFDSCGSSERVTQQVLNFELCEVGLGETLKRITPSRVLGYVGPDRSGEAAALAPMFGQLNKALVSHAATSASLSEEKNLLRTVPSDQEQFSAMVAIVKKMGWDYVQLVHSPNTYGTTGAEAFEKTARTHSTCAVQKLKMPEEDEEDEDDEYTDLMIRLSQRAIGDGEGGTRAVVVIANDNYVKRLLQAAQREGFRNRFYWLGTNSWGTNTEIMDNDVGAFARGALTMSLPHDESLISDLRVQFGALDPSNETYNPWLAQYWENKFGCRASDPNCVNDNTIDHLDSYVSNTVYAVDAILLGVEAARKEKCGGSNNFCQDFMDILNSGDLASVTTNIRTLTTSDGEVFDLSSGDWKMGSHIINNYRPEDPDEPNKQSYYKVGTYSDTNLEMNKDEVYLYYENGTRDPAPSTACGDDVCNECKGIVSEDWTNQNETGKQDGDDDDDPPVELRDGVWVIILIVLAGVGLFLVIIIEIFLLCRMAGTTLTRRFRTFWLGQLLLFSIFLCYLALFAFVPSPTKASCGIIRFCVGVCYAMPFAILLVKLMIILSSESIGYLKGIFQVLMFIFAWGVQIGLDTTWMILYHPKAVYEGEEWECDISFESHITSLSYVMFLIVVCALLAIRAHGIETNHREGALILMAAGFTIPIWIIWILLGALKGDSWEDPCMAFGLLATATLLLLVMFLPKVWQLRNMKKDSIYSPDDRPTPDYAHSIMAPSVVPVDSIPASSVIANNVAYTNNVHYPAPKSLPDTSSPLVMVDGALYETVPTNHKRLHVGAVNPNALYLKHLGSSTAGDAISVRSMPVSSHLRPRPVANHHTAGTARTFRVTNDLTGRRVFEAHPDDDSQHYGTTRSNKSLGSARSEPVIMTLSKARSLQDLGAL